MRNFMDLCYWQKYRIRYIDTQCFRIKQMNALYFTFSYVVGILTSKIIMHPSIEHSFVLLHNIIDISIDRKVIFQKFYRAQIILC